MVFLTTHQTRDLRLIFLLGQSTLYIGSMVFNDVFKEHGLSNSTDTPQCIHRSAPRKQTKNNSAWAISVLSFSLSSPRIKSADFCASPSLRVLLSVISALMSCQLGVATLPWLLSSPFLELALMLITQRSSIVAAYNKGE